MPPAKTGTIPAAAPNPPHPPVRIPCSGPETVPRPQTPTASRPSRQPPTPHRPDTRGVTALVPGALPTADHHRALRCQRRPGRRWVSALGCRYVAGSGVPRR